MMKPILAAASLCAMFYATSCNKCITCKKNNTDKVEVCKGDPYYEYASGSVAAFTDSLGNTYTGCN